MDEFTISVDLPVEAEELYEAWMDSEEHAAFSGGEADIKPVEGGKFTAWNGYIWGETIELTPGSRIVQSWRTAEFNEDAPDSNIVVEFEDFDDHTTLTLTHTNLQPGDGDKYKEGWEDSYFAPMRDYYQDK